jgi:molybdenum cofactor synthesis domain-containing protein
MDNHGRLDPETAYAQWTDACSRAGWQPGDEDTERVSLADGLGRVTAQPVTARWPSPREDCAAMDGIAVAAGIFGSADSNCPNATSRRISTGVVPDDPDLLAAAIRQAAATADLVLVIAGSSRGRDDYTSAVLAQVGGLIVAGVSVRPGHPAILGYAKSPVTGTVPVVGLPGYPIATAVTFELFAAPLLGTIQGTAAEDKARPATLTTEWRSCPDKEEWVPVTLSHDGKATPTGHGASSTSHLAAATAWWRIPPGTKHFPPGTKITVMPWD